MRKVVFLGGKKVRNNMTISDYARGLLDSSGEVLVKSEEVIKRLNDPTTSIYTTEATQVTRRSDTMGLGKVLEQTGEASENQLSDLDQPIVDKYAMQEGFFGSQEIIYTEGVAPLKALLSSEGMISEGKYYHTGVTTEVLKSTGVLEEELDDAFTAREATDVFAKREQAGGWDKEKGIVTRKDNISGLRMTAPFEYSDPWQPEIGNRLGKIASGLAYKFAEPFYDFVNEEYSPEEKTAVLLVCTRNANGPVLDRRARERYISGLHLNMSDNHSVALLGDLMRQFRVARGSLAVPANSPSNSVLRIGMPFAEHSISGKVIWSNEQKLRHIKELSLSSGEMVYMASSYLNHQLFTVPIDLDLLEDERDESGNVVRNHLFSDLALWQQLAMRYCVNQSRKILGFQAMGIDPKELDSLSEYEINDYPTVYDALNLSEETNTEAKRRILSSVEKYVSESIISWKEAVEAKALDRYMQDSPL